MTSPYDDREEISNYIETQENALNYDVDDDENQISATRNNTEYIEALDDQRAYYADDEVGGINQDEDPPFFDDTEQ